MGLTLVAHQCGKAVKPSKTIELSSANRTANNNLNPFYFINIVYNMGEDGGVAGMSNTNSPSHSSCSSVLTLTQVSKSQYAMSRLVVNFLHFLPTCFDLIDPKLGGEKCVCTKLERACKKKKKKNVSTMVNEDPG